MPNPKLVDKLRFRKLGGFDEIPEARPTDSAISPNAPTSPAADTATSPSAPKSSMTKNIIIGVGAVIFIVATIVIIKKLRK